MYLFTDNCTGQNKNHFIVQMMSVQASKRKITVHLIYLEKGHTQNINHAVHSIIEKAKKGVNINHPLQWITLIEKASQKNPFKGTFMSTKDFFNFKTDLADSFLPLIKDSTPLKGKKEVMKVHWLKIREIKCEPAVDKIHIDFRYNVSSAFQSVVIRSVPRKTRKSDQKLFNLRKVTPVKSITKG